jgi:hypothetical protein
MKMGVTRIDPKEIVTETTNKKITVYVCPTPGCPDYFGSSTMGDLSQEFTGPMVENRAKLTEETGSPYKHSRAECPTCRIKGIKVERVPLTTTLKVPAVGPPTPSLPPSTSKSRAAAQSD